MQVLNDLLATHAELERMRLTLSRAAEKVKQAIDEIKAIDLGEKSQSPSIDVLSKREKQIFKMLATLDMAGIQAKLFLKRKTIENHRENIRKKLKLEIARDVVREAKRLYTPLG